MAVDLTHERYPRAGRYDVQWVLDNQMGPHVLWLLESLTQLVEVEPGMRVLDLGCGTAMSSIFLAREFDVDVTAVDLWIPAEDNERRIADAGLTARVHAIAAEAHALPFDDDAFDLVVSVDAYHYFGTDDLYLGYITRFLRPGGRLAVVSPATTTELDGTPPAGLAKYWHWEFCSFHSPDWWRRHWTKTGLVEVEAADLVPDGWRDWHRFNIATAPSLHGWRAEAAQREAEMLAVDQGETLGFARVVATRPTT